jgi:hypothetical protein
MTNAKLKTANHIPHQPLTANWQPATGNQQLVTGNWQPATGNRKPLTLLTVHHSCAFLSGQSRWRWTRSYVENIAAAIAHTTKDPGTDDQIFNLGSEPALQEAEWIGQIAQAGWHGTILKVPAEKLPVHLCTNYNWAQDWIIDATKFSVATGFKEPFTTADRLKRTVAWIRSRPRTFSDSLCEKLIKENEAAERVNSDAGAERNGSCVQSDRSYKPYNRL